MNALLNSLFGVTGALIFFIGFIIFIMTIVKKKSKKIPIILIIIGIIIFFIGASIPYSKQETKGNKNTNNPSSTTKQSISSKKGSKSSKGNRKTSDDNIQSMILTISKKAILKQEKLKEISIDSDSVEYNATGGTNNKRWEVSGELTQPNDNHVYSFFLTITFKKDILNKNTSLNGIEYSSDVIKVIY